MGQSIDSCGTPHFSSSKSITRQYLNKQRTVLEVKNNANIWVKIGACPWYQSCLIWHCLAINKIQSFKNNSTREMILTKITETIFCVCIDLDILCQCYFHFMVILLSFKWVDNSDTHWGSSIRALTLDLVSLQAWSYKMLRVKWTKLLLPGTWAICACESNIVGPLKCAV